MTKMGLMQIKGAIHSSLLHQPHLHKEIIIGRDEPRSNLIIQDPDRINDRSFGESRI